MTEAITALQCHGRGSCHTIEVHGRSTCHTTGPWPMENPVCRIAKRSGLPHNVMKLVRSTGHICKSLVARRWPFVNASIRWSRGRASRGQRSKAGLPPGPCHHLGPKMTSGQGPMAGVIIGGGTSNRSSRL